MDGYSCNEKLKPVHTSNNVEATFDYVEATFFVHRIVRLVTFDNVASTLLHVWMGFNRKLYVAISNDTNTTDLE